MALRTPRACSAPRTHRAPKPRTRQRLAFATMATRKLHLIILSRRAAFARVRQNMLGRRRRFRPLFMLRSHVLPALAAARAIAQSLPASAPPEPLRPLDTTAPAQVLAEGLLQTMDARSATQARMLQPGPTRAQAVLQAPTPRAVPVLREHVLRARRDPSRLSARASVQRAALAQVLPFQAPALAPAHRAPAERQARTTVQSVSVRREHFLLQVAATTHLETMEVALTALLARLRLPAHPRVVIALPAPTR